MFVTSSSFVSVKLLAHARHIVIRNPGEPVVSPGNFLQLTS